MNLSELPADVIFAKLADLLRSERYAHADFLLHLAEVDRRRLFAKSGHGSLWDFCEQKLGLQKSATYVRVTAVDLVQRYPAAVEYVRDGRVSMSALAMLKSVLTAENAREWLDRISGKSCREVEDLTGEVRPRSARKDGIRKLPAAPAARESTGEAAADLFGSKDSEDHAAPLVSIPSAPSPSSPSVSPLVAPPSDPAGASPPSAILNSRSAKPTTPAEETYRLTLTVGARFKKLLDDAAALSSHKIPRKDPGAVLLLALEDLVEKLRKRKGIGRAPRSKREPRTTNEPAAGATEALPQSDPPNRSVPKSPKPGRRCVPADVVRGVWERDEGCCAWKTPDGTKCGSTWQLELDHDPPLARGGTSTVDGCRLLCRRHNQRAARDVFGDQFMDRFRRRPDSAFPDVRSQPPTDSADREAEPSPRVGSETR